MTHEAHPPSRDRLKKLIDAVVKHLPQGLQVDHTCIPEDSLVQLCRMTKSLELRCGLAELYRAGYFGRHDVVSGYAWTLATWSCRHISYDNKFKLAETQQYYEFCLSPDEQAEAIRIIERILPDAEHRNYVAGKPFNGEWWGWEDDPIPARPGERDFKAKFGKWLIDGCYSEREISEIVARCPASDGPTRMERIKRDVDKMFGRQGPIAEGIPKTILPKQ